MKQEIENNLKIKIAENSKTYITLEEIETIINEKIEYIELVNLIKSFISDGILKPVRKR